ncbi:MAG TPA: hypothetical protein VGX91_07985 [Candidatus Cybelea sp.]|jgi:hypothetical protein|nr:hypothetical protein [Candidatus Cybelea sp.]
MKDTQGHRFVLGGAVAAFVLAACSGGTSTPSGATFASSPIAAYASGVTKHHDYQHSWSHVKPSLTKLLYVSDDVTDDVYIYAYPSGTLVAAITGFVMPSGLCVRQPGLIFVTDTGASDIKEYKFGGTNPIQTISDAGEYPVSCSVNPTTGRLAVANYETTSFGPGSISVYPPPYSTSTVYADPTMQNFYFIGYRPNGRIFADGINTAGAFQLDKLLPPTFSIITLAPAITTPGNVQWSGTSLVVGDQTGNLFYRYTIAGLFGTAGPSSTFTGACDVLQFFVNGAGTKIVGPDSCGTPPNADTYAFPAGGLPIPPSVTTPLGKPVGSAILNS